MKTLKHILFMAIATSCLILTAGCESPGPFGTLNKATAPIARINDDVQPPVINVKDKLVLDELKSISDIYASAFTELEKESKGIYVPNREKFYSTIIAQQTELSSEADQLKDLANDQNRGLHDQCIMNIRSMVVDLGSKLKDYQDQTDAKTASMLDAVSKLNQDLSNVLRASGGIGSDINADSTSSSGFAKAR